MNKKIKETYLSLIQFILVIIFNIIYLFITIIIIMKRKKKHQVLKNLYLN